MFAYMERLGYVDGMERLVQRMPLKSELTITVSCAHFDHFMEGIGQQTAASRTEPEVRWEWGQCQEV